MQLLNFVVVSGWERPYKCRADQGCTDVAVRDGRYYLIQQNW